MWKKTGTYSWFFLVCKCQNYAVTYILSGAMTLTVIFHGELCTSNILVYTVWALLYVHTYVIHILLTYSTYKVCTVYFSIHCVHICACSLILFTYMMNGCLPMGYLHDLVLHCHNESNDENHILKMVCICTYILY